MTPSPQPPSPAVMNLPGKLTTHDPDTYIVVCLHCLHYFRSLTELLRHRLLNHNILDNVSPGEMLPRVSKDGTWLVTGGDTELNNIMPPPVQSTSSVPTGLRAPPNVFPTPSPPPHTIHVPQSRSLVPHHQLQSSLPQYQHYSSTPPPPANRPIQQPQSFHPSSSAVSAGVFNRPVPGFQLQQQQQQFSSPLGSASPSPTPQGLGRGVGSGSSTTTTFSAAAKEFVPLSMASKAPGRAT